MFSHVKKTQVTSGIFHVVNYPTAANTVQVTVQICNGNTTEWSPIRSVSIRVITKSDDHTVEVRLVYHECDYRLNWTTQSLTNHKNYNFREKKNSQVTKERENLHYRTGKGDVSILNGYRAPYW